MKTIIALGMAVALLGATGSSIFAQTQTTSSSTTTTYMETSKLIGTTVKGPNGDQIGQIKDVVLDSNGCMAYTVVSTGGTGKRLTGGGKTVAVPWAVYTRTSDPRVMTVRVEREKIYNAPAFDYARINEYSTGGYINNVYSYYGVSGGTAVGVSAGVNNTTTTTNTGVNTTTANTGVNATTTNTGVNTTNTAGATASPYPSVTPAATASATMTPTSTATPKATATSSPAPSASATSSPMSHKTHAGSTPSAKRHTSETESNGEGSGSAKAKHRSEGNGSSDEGTSKSSKKHRSSGEEPKSEPESTPSGD